MAIGKKSNETNKMILSFYDTIAQNYYNQTFLYINPKVPDRIVANNAQYLIDYNIISSDHQLQKVYRQKQYDIALN